jgi:peptidoglycan-N-acetylglucosamine deacetylase
VTAAGGPVAGPARSRAVSREVHLTFDAEHPNRPHWRAEGAESVLAVLAEFSVPATFFVQGRWASANPELARRIAQSGHTIGSHSNAHLDLTLLSDDGLVAEVAEARERIHAATGVDPRPFFRCPYGAGHDDARIIETLAGMGYRLVGWDVDPQDWDQERTTEDIVRTVSTTLRQSASVATVLLHTWPGSTAEALRRILRDNADGVTWTALVDNLDD